VHTAIVVIIGLVLPGTCLFIGHMLGGGAGTAHAALAFLPLWLAGSGINMYLGVRSAGYSIAEESPVFLFVFAIPAVAALVAWWRFH
jgi:hypothetical protein